MRAIYYRRVQYKVIASCQGTFGRVLQERDCDGRAFARKYLKTTFKGQRQEKANLMYQSEVAILDKINKTDGVRHIITMIRADLAHNPPYIDFEWMEGNLHQLIKERQKLDENTALQLLHQIAMGLYFLNRITIIHRDLKPENILYSPAKAGNNFLKIADFGAATHYPPHNTKVTTPPYEAPEMVSTNYGYGVDVWALGCILFEMCTGKILFRDETSKTVLNKRSDLFQGSKRHKLFNITPQVWGLIKKMVSEQDVRLPIQLLIIELRNNFKINPDN